MSIDSATSRAGVAFSLVASGLFALLYYYAAQLAPLGSDKIYGWRILLTVPFMAGFIFLSGRRADLAALWRKILRNPRLWPGLLLSSALLGVQLWLFMWAPVNGYALDVSLGYFLLPLTLVLTGRIVFGERISRIQLIACAIAAVGVINELIFAPRISWPTFVVAFLYPVYYVLRRKMGTDTLGGAWLDMALSLPLSIWFILGPLPEAAREWEVLTIGILVVGLGLLSAVALALMIAASQKLKLGIFGLLSYVEPALLVVVALVLGERIAPSQWLTYGSIWAAIALMAGESILRMRRGSALPKSAPPERQG
ncbi:EamA family transporter RarD [Xanthobacter sp. TB0136]|uniref:EamA family transporter RarD n=1 Tax=Xanthobacter sp. TB0136 TaxID=3459177 RepID=UPI004039BB7B